MRINTLSALLVMVSCMIMAFSPAAYAQTEPFALGADISWVQQQENCGVRFRQSGSTQNADMLDILKANGFNWIRLRLFVDPTAGVPADSAKARADNPTNPWFGSPYNTTNEARCSQTAATAAYCGLDSTVKYAKRVKDAGFKFLLDFHYSDTWADPGKQFKPVSWLNLTTNAQVEQKVYDYTKESVQAFVNAGARPDMVQVGNEVVVGMIHPNGNGNSANFARLVNAGIKGVKDVDQNIQIMMHTISERNPNGWVNTLRTNLNNIEQGAANRIDVIGLSYYPSWHGDRDSLRRVLTAISNNTNHSYKINVVEYADYHREVNDLVWQLPANRRHGTFVWEPQQFSGDNSKPLFNKNANPRLTNSLMDLFPQMASDYGLTGTANIGNNNQNRANAGRRQSNDFTIARNGVIDYHSAAPGRVTVYTLQGRVAGRFDIRSPGRYDPAKLLRGSMRSGAYIIAVESAGGAKQTFVSRVIKT